MNYRYDERKKIFLSDMESKNIKMISEYTNAQAKAKFKCLTCGCVFDKNVYQCSIQDTPCPDCRKIVLRKNRQLKMHKVFNQRIKDLNKPNFVPVDYPETLFAPSTYLHTTCGNYIHTTISNLAKNKNNNKGCEYCSHTHTYTPQEIKDYIAVYRSDYDYIDSYIENKHLMVTLKHSCGRKYSIEYNQFISGKNCSACAGGVRKDNATFNKEVQKLGNGDYVLLSEYNDSHSHVKMLHKVCGKEYTVSPTAFLGGVRCPFCAESKGESLITTILNSMNVNFEKQKKFDNCKYKDKLPFDFYLAKYNLLLEYDGIQHYESVPFFGGDRMFWVCKLRDKIKDNYAIKNNIELVRIPYTFSDNQVKNVIKQSLVIQSKAESPISKSRIKR